MEVRLWQLLRCRGVSRLVALGELDDAPPLRRFLAALHLLICRHCRFYLLQLSLIKRAARHWADGLSMGLDQEAFEKRLLARLYRRD